MLVVYALTVVFLVSSLAWFITTWSSPLPFESYVTIGIALTNIMTFRTGFAMALYTKESWRELLRQGHFNPHEQKASAYLRFLETRGTAGRLPGAVRWALVYFAAYYSLIGLSVVFVSLLLPLLGPLTPVAFLAIDAPLVLVCARTYRSRMLEPLSILSLPKKPFSSP